MRVSQGAPGARILAFGRYQPARSVTNDELAQTMDTNDEWIRSGSASPAAGSPRRTRRGGRKLRGGRQRRW